MVRRRRHRPDHHLTWLSDVPHDPVDWTLVQGAVRRGSLGRSWQELFDSHELVHNRREIVRIEVSREGDGAFAVVDIDTLWRSRVDGSESHWLGRTCKAYACVGAEWKMTMQTGALRYGDDRGSV